MKLTEKTLMYHFGMESVVTEEIKQGLSTTFSGLSAPTPWPGANARLLGLGVGLPIAPLVRLSQFSAAEFERFTLEWASDYLARQQYVNEVQQRGGAGDKGRDIVVWLDPTNVSPRRWHLYQCKHYDTNLGLPKAGIEIAKVIYYTFISDYTAPEEYYFVTHKGVTSPFQDLLDDPENSSRRFFQDGRLMPKRLQQNMKFPDNRTSKLY